LKLWSRLYKESFIFVNFYRKNTRLSTFLFVSHSTRLLLKSQNDEEEENPIINIEQIRQKNNIKIKLSCHFCFRLNETWAVFAYLPLCLNTAKRAKNKIVQSVSWIKINKAWYLFLGRFRQLLNRAVFLVAAGKVLKIGSILKPNHHREI